MIYSGNEQKVSAAPTAVGQNYFSEKRIKRTDERDKIAIDSISVEIREEAKELSKFRTNYNLVLLTKLV